MSNPLVATAQSDTTAVTGIGIAESSMDLANGISNGDWVEGGLGAVGVGLEVLSMVIDPVGTIASYGVSWLIEHVQPLKQALDWFAGDPPVIRSFSETWANVAAEVNKVAGDYGNEIKAGTAGWTGQSADVYRGKGAETADAIAGAGALADGISAGVMIMGEVVAAVRELVRDLVAEVVGKLITWALEAVATLGLATPVIVAQATAAISKVVNKIADLVRKLVKTIGNVTPRIRKVIDKLDEIIAKLGKLGRKADGTPGSTSPSSATTPDGVRSPDTTSPSSVDSPGSTSPDGPSSTTSPNSSTTSPDGTTTPSGTNRPANPHDSKTSPAGRRCENDPVDVVTGEVVLSQTDVSLPGALPLVLQRTHVSSWRAGRSYGRSWSSTLDQRLEFDDLGVVFITEDGMRLCYPQPPVEGTVLADAGPRWPLARSGHGYAVHQPESGQTREFQADGRISAIHDRNGRRIQFGYDTRGALADIRHSGGYHIEVVSDQEAVTELRLAGQDITLVRYRHEHGLLTEVTNSSGQALKFEYDLAGRITRWVDRTGTWYRYFYDADGRCIANQGADGFLNGTFAYDTENRITRFTDSLGNTTSYLLNDTSKVVAETDPLGNTTTFEWDEFDRLLTRTDPLGRTMRYEYDEPGNPVRVTMPDGSQALAEYNELRQPTVNIDPDGAIWQQEYDERGNLLRAVDPAGAVTRYSYNDRGFVETITDAAGNERRIETNAAGLPVMVTDSFGRTSRYSRDQFGRLVAMTDALGATTRLAWTLEGNLLSRTSPDGAVERWRYDGEGAEIEYIDQLGQVARAETTHFDLIAARIDRDGARTTFTYDTNLRLVAVTNPQGLVWQYTYDAAGNVVQEQDFNGRVMSYRYDSAGQLVERVNGAGEVTRYTRDSLGRTVERRVSEAVTTYSYDPAGRIERAANADAQLDIVRDQAGRIVAETVNGRTVHSRYDVLGRRIGRRTPTGTESTWTYDANNQPISLLTGGHAISFGYDELGREVTRSMNASPVLVQGWDSGNRLAAQTVHGRAEVLQQRRYHYRPDSIVSAIDDQLTGTRRFDADPVGRITGVQAAGWREQYVYDSAGNLANSREYDGTLLQTSPDALYRHDAQGRVVMRQKRRLSRKPDTWHYTWDGDDRLAAVVTPDGTRWRYRYDPLGRRIAKQRLGMDGTVAEQVDFVWDGLTLAEQIHSSGQATTWEWDSDSCRPISQLERTTTGQGWVDARFFAIVTDMLGTPTELVDAGGNLAWHAQTTAWGEAIGNLRHTGYTPLRFPGQYHDPETGLNYNYFRYYDPENARYVSADPLGLRPSVNPFGYVENPFRSTDPLGLMSCDEDTIRNLDPNDPDNRTRRSEAWHRIYGQDPATLRNEGARQAAREVRRGACPRDLQGGRVDAPQSNIPGSQYHAQGAGRGSPGLNQDGTYHDGRPNWRRETYEWLYERGWAWPRTDPPPGNPPTHHPW
jgi:RHS repeat-associated protein